MEQRYDAIVVGAGLGGLSCALHLAKKGASVLVLEKQPKVGGYAQNFVRDGYEFDVSLHVLAAMNPSGGLHRLLDYLQVRDKLDVVPRTPMFTSYFPDASYRIAGGEDAVAAWSQEFPEAARDIARFYDTMAAIVGANTQLFWTGEIPDDFFPARYFKKTYAQLLAEHFAAPRLRALMDQLWQSTGLPAAHCAANWAAEVWGSHLLTGNYYIRGGGQRLSNAMAATLCEAGSSVRTGALVRRILVRDRAVTGVELDSGERLFSDVVVCNANPLQVYRTLIGDQHLARPFVYKLERLRTSCSLLTIYLGLDCPASAVGLRDHTAFFNHGDDTAAAYELAMQGAHDRTDFVISDYTDEASGCHPPGCGIVQILEPVDGRAWTDIPRSAYEEKKQQVTEQILTKVAGHFPELRRHIRVCEVATPRTMALSTRNPGGSVYGFAQTPDQADNWRFPVPGIFTGLYFTGAWSRGGGGGYMGAIVNGRVAAHQVISRHRWSRTDVVFDVAPRRTDSPSSAPGRDTARDPGADTAVVVAAAPHDVDGRGHLAPHGVLRLAGNAVEKWAAAHQEHLARQWNLPVDAVAHPVLFHSRVVAVPGVAVAAGDELDVALAVEVVGPAKAQITAVLTRQGTGEKLGDVQGRVWFR